MGLHSISAFFDNPTNISGYDDNFDINGDVLFEFVQIKLLIPITQVTEKKQRKWGIKFKSIKQSVRFRFRFIKCWYFGENDDFGIKR